MRENARPTHLPHSLGLTPSHCIRSTSRCRSSALLACETGATRKSALDREGSEERMSRAPASGCRTCSTTGSRCRPGRRPTGRRWACCAVSQAAGQSAPWMGCRKADALLESAREQREELARREVRVALPLQMQGQQQQQQPQTRMTTSARTDRDENDAPPAPPPLAERLERGLRRARSVGSASSWPRERGDNRRLTSFSMTRISSGSSSSACASSESVSSVGVWPRQTIAAIFSREGMTVACCRRAGGQPFALGMPRAREGRTLPSLMTLPSSLTSWISIALDAKSPLGEAVCGAVVSARATFVAQQQGNARQDARR